MDSANRMTRAFAVVDEFRHLIRRYKLIAITAVIGPVLVLSTFALFPVLDRWNLGYSYFRLATFSSFMIGNFGLLAWLIGKPNRLNLTQWVYPIGFLSLIIGTIYYYIHGGFYWAFERGYFLD